LLTSSILLLAGRTFQKRILEEAPPMAGSSNEMVFTPLPEPADED
jgi:hypothetical protein